jgi:thiol:disulfide interchange protein
MESFKQGMSFLLIGTAGYMLWILGGLVDEGKLLSIILGAVLVAFACWVYGRWCLPYKPVTTQRWSGLVAALALGGGIWMGWPEGKAEGKLEWATWTPAAVADYVDQGDLVYVDFTARWCATCQVNKHVYSDPAVAAAFKKHGVRLLKADWTNQNPEIAAVLKDFNAAAVPLNVLYSLNHPPVVVNADNLFASEVLDALAKVQKK